ncbi:hypothetical protein CLUG_04050 [Clavispora lusitaniae ATCC 42720]|uniref:Uncharacterized protein n=1 Tax=Clavispora lusitaniae (strain ATCC 42720) TaxID=306902 RepID=C4Y7B6_CLAL4|nr:uncharacterized protein CLUG_04050 [Clavispora lusitaniae ATCC 42720]EEQ39922.1 hypothetical protein CLUG_04050 [Clavispora lusitaniae ATCC 42720]
MTVRLQNTSCQERHFWWTTTSISMTRMISCCMCITTTWSRMTMSRSEVTFRKLGVKMTYIRNRLYDVYLRSSHEEDPALHKNTLKNKKVQHPLSVLLNGPTAVITIPKCEPSVVEQVMKILKQAGEKLILIGARIETSIYNIDDLDKFKSLPNKEQMQSQLAGLLTVLGGAGLVRTLESNGTMLYLTLEQRRKDQDPSSEEQEN